MIESWNGLLNEYRRKPLIDLLEFIRLKIIKRLIRRKEKAVAWDIVPLRVHIKIAKIAKVARKFIVVKASQTEFKMLDKNVEKERHYVVELDQAYCECGSWQISGIPCKHALACIMQCSADPAEYVDPTLRKDVYLVTYSHTIRPLTRSIKLA